MKEASDVVKESWESERFLLFANTGEDLISGIRVSHQQALPLRVFLSWWPGREIRGNSQGSLSAEENTDD